jgi:GrpB-like predicted nucleotidyltransferase (UPF0157 family)
VPPDRHDVADANESLSADELGRKYPIVIVEYDPAWPLRHEREMARLTGVLSPGLILRTEHIGSTAVPGLAAKPVIDVLAEVPSFDIAERELVPAMRDAGYVEMWTTAASPGHWLFVTGYGPEGYLDGVQLFHVHTAPADHAIWERPLLRDYLRTHPDAAARYEAIKRRLAAEHRFNRGDYTAAKTEPIEEMMREARRRLTARPARTVMLRDGVAALHGKRPGAADDAGVAAVEAPGTGRNRRPRVSSRLAGDTPENSRNRRIADA